MIGGRNTVVQKEKTDSRELYIEISRSFRPVLIGKDLLRPPKNPPVISTPELVGMKSSPLPVSRPDYNRSRTHGVRERGGSLRGRRLNRSINGPRKQKGIT